MALQPPEVRFGERTLVFRLPWKGKKRQGKEKNKHFSHPETPVPSFLHKGSGFSSTFPSLTADRNFAYSLAGGQVQRSSGPPTSRTCRMYAEIGKAPGVDYTWENCRERAKVELRCSEGGERQIDGGNEDQPKFNIVADPTQEENQGKSRAWRRRG
ncbi:hypothetical protein B0T13DRAFT_475576 [Neurospora crassa]|nr:hypothetical protein B0T13DRAFT_475576 [Neurospora crassa]